MHVSTVTGYDAVKKAISEAKGKIFVAFLGSHNDKGVSWCPDCVTSEPVLNQVAHSDEAKNHDSTFIFCYVGQREYWKDPACPFRTDPAIHISCIPTVIEVGAKERLVDEPECANTSKIQKFLFGKH